MTFAHGIDALTFQNSTLFGFVYVKIYLFHFKLRKNCLMLGEFECDQYVFVHLFREKLLFDINDSAKFLSTQVRSFLANFLQNSPCHARR